jgi:3',5'-cyclic AMP phosphodiesterase CpdA
MQLAHLSDLHLGERPEHEASARALVQSLLREDVDHVVVTGDITHSGRIEEYELWLELFEPLLLEKKVTVVPGNHDRGGDAVAELLSDELRVSVDGRAGLFMVCIDSTAPHNKSSFRSHGDLCEKMLVAVDEALDLAPPGWTSVLLLHHHLLPMPVEGIGEWFAERFGWPHAAELPLGKELLRRVQGRADLALHGHKHVPMERVLAGLRPLRVANAGASTVLRAFRVFEFDGADVRAGRWVQAGAPTPVPFLARVLHGQPRVVPDPSATSSEPP